MRDWLASYVWYLGKQRVKPSRRADRRFHEFHRRELELIDSELGANRSFRTGLRACGLLLRQVHGSGAEAAG